MSSPLAWIRAATVCMLALVGAFPVAAWAAIWDELTDAQVQEALQYGRARATEPLERLVEPWMVRAPDGSAAIVVRSDFVSLAYLGWNEKRNGRPLTARELDEAVFVLRALRKTLHVEGIVPSSAFGYVEAVELLDGTTGSHLISLEFKLERKEAREDWRFDAYFLRAGLAPTSKPSVRIRGSTGKHVVIPVDLSKIR